MKSNLNGQKLLFTPIILANIAIIKKKTQKLLLVYYKFKKRENLFSLFYISIDTNKTKSEETGKSFSCNDQSGKSSQKSTWRDLPQT